MACFWEISQKFQTHTILYQLFHFFYIQQKWYISGKFPRKLKLMPFLLIQSFLINKTKMARIQTTNQFGMFSKFIKHLICLSEVMPFLNLSCFFFINPKMASLERIFCSLIKKCTGKISH